MRKCSTHFDERLLPNKLCMHPSEPYLHFMSCAKFEMFSPLSGYFMVQIGLSCACTA